ncbi:MAG: acyl-CoA dehydrogenase family protein [Chloroflexota bacterium]
MTVAQAETSTLSPKRLLAATRPANFVRVDTLLTQQELAIQARVREFVDERVIPIMAGRWDAAEFPFELVPELARLGVPGGSIQGYGCSGWSSVAYGLALQEIARGAGSLATFLHVQSGLAMTVIHELGSEEQKELWLPALARCEKVGCFALTEPDVGSDAASIATTARRDGAEYVLQGRKRWIGNASFADIAIICARGEDDKVGVFLVEGDNPGYHAEPILQKGSQRAVVQAEIELCDCRIPESNRLPGGRGLGSILSCLTESRFGVAWDGLGQALDCYEIALAYALERRQFGQPLAGFQLVQHKLVTMITELSEAQLLSIHIGRLKDAGRLEPGQVSMLKMSNLTKARQVAALAREVLGGNGILLDYRIMEHMADIEGAYTYEGANDINMLIVGQAITGHKAFAAAPSGQQSRISQIEETSAKDRTGD